MLVGLAVHGDQRLGELAQQRRRDAGTAGEGPGAALGGDLPGQQQPAVLELAAGLLDQAGHAVDGPAVDHALDEGAR